MKIAIKVSKYFGGVRKMAIEMGCSTQYIYQWPNGNAPKTASYQLDVITNGFFNAVALMNGIVPDCIIEKGYYVAPLQKKLVRNIQKGKNT